MLSDREAQKRAAAERAVELVQSGMRLGLGTGSTARHVLDVISERLSRGELHDIVGVATSTATEQQARALQIPIRTLDEVKQLDLGIDGADEVDPQLNLIKGLGGALLWEKIVASACEQFIVVGDDTKLVERLGSKAPVPVEVVAFGWSTHLDAFAELGARPILRTKPDGSAFWTDGGHYIIDCAFTNGIPNPYELEAELKSRPGVVETGLFLDMTSHVIVADPAGARTLSR